MYEIKGLHVSFANVLVEKPQIFDMFPRLGKFLNNIFLTQDYFENILNHSRFLAYYNVVIDLIVAYDLIDMLYTLEEKMSKITVEVKVIIDAKWKKYLKELNVVRDATQHDVGIDMAIWEVIEDIKALPSEESD